MARRRKTGGTHRVLNPRGIPADIACYSVVKQQGEPETVDYFEGDTFTPPDWMDPKPDIEDGFLEVVKDG